MSRIGKKLIELPPGVTVATSGRVVDVKGLRGSLSWQIPEGIALDIDDKGSKVQVTRSGDSKVHRALHGLTRSLLQNMVTGVHAGFLRQLDIVGVGYKAEVSGNNLVLNLGYSHPIQYPIPAGIQIKVEKVQKKPLQNYIATISVAGIDKQAVGQVAANIRSLRPPGSYRGKGIRYQNEVIRLKVGKKTA